MPLYVVSNCNRSMNFERVILIITVIQLDTEELPSSTMKFYLKLLFPKLKCINTVISVFLRAH